MSNALGICDRCSFRVRHRELRQEWTSLLVCSRCWDPRPVWLDPPVISPLEGMPVANARYDRDATNPQFIETEIDPDDL